MDEKKVVNVLSIDGGGIRGVIIAEILSIFENRLKNITNNPNIKLADHFDLIVGTSTGAILASIYTVPNDERKAKYSASEAVDLYIKHGGEIFSKSNLYTWKTLFGLFGAKYDDKYLNKTLKKYLGNFKVREAVTNVMISSVDIYNRALFLFKSYDVKGDFNFTDAVRASTAAPSYFKPLKLIHLDREVNLIDGGMAINNPAISAYVEAKKLYTEAKKINLLSLGSGKNNIEYSYSVTKKFGHIRWLKPMIDIIVSSNSEAVDYQTELLYKGTNKGHYLRINNNLKHASYKIDDASSDNISNLRKDALEFINIEEIDEYIKKTLK